MTTLTPPLQSKSRATVSLPGWPLKVLAGLALVLALTAGYQLSGHTVNIAVNGQVYPVATHRLTVESVLLQTGLSLRPEDELLPSVGQSLLRGQPIQLKLARPVVLDSLTGDAPRTLLTQNQTPQAIFAQAGVPLSPADDIYVNGQLWSASEPIPITLPAPPSEQAPLRTQIEAQRPQPVRLTLHQAIPITIEDGDRRLSLDTTAQTVGDIIQAENIPLYLGDAISPDLSASLSPEMTITIDRSVPVQVVVDGQMLHTRTRRKTVGQVLAQEGVLLVGQDYSLPAETEPVQADTRISVVRVDEVLEVSKDVTGFEVQWLPDPELALDTQRQEQAGQEGVTKTRTRVRYENGQEVARVQEETWLDQEPADRIVRYGTNIVVRTVDTPNGPLEYWRKISMLATSYSAATSGKSKDDPLYGITRTGMQAGYGVVAVDPSVVRLRSELYVPGYGQAIAGDTGGAILGKHIDLGFDEDRPPLWYRWVDVYLLTPVPPASNIRYVLPTWPQR